jgi:hypothetical protein
MPTQCDTVRDRIASVCASAPFQFLEAETPFDFTLQPTTQIDQVFRLTCESDEVIGGFNYTEERTDLIEIWVARKQGGAPRIAYDALVTDVSSLRAAIIRDGATGGGDYCVPDGTEFSLQHDDGKEYAVLRVVIPVNYEATV